MKLNNLLEKYRTLYFKDHYNLPDMFPDDMMKYLVITFGEYSSSKKEEILNLIFGKGKFRSKYENEGMKGIIDLINFLKDVQEYSMSLVTVYNFSINPDCERECIVWSYILAAKANGCRYDLDCLDPEWIYWENASVYLPKTIEILRILKYSMKFVIDCNGNYVSDDFLEVYSELNNFILEYGKHQKRIQ